MPPSIKRLPVSVHPWEVDVVPSPMTVDNQPLEGVLLVVESVTGTVRHAVPIVPGEGLRKHLLRACRSEIKGISASRPSVVRVRRRGLVRRLGDAANARVEVVADLPEVDAAFEGLYDHFAPLPVHVHRPELWAPVVARMWGVAPWNDISDAVSFRFVGGPPELQGTVATLLGNGGEQYGLVLYPTEVDYRVFDGAARGDLAEQAWELTRVYCFHLDEEDDVPTGLPRSVRQAGALLKKDGMVPMMFGMDHGEPHKLAPEQEDALRCAVEAVTAVHVAVGAAVEWRDGEVRVPTSFGDVVVSTTAGGFDEAEPLVFNVAHQVVITQVVRGRRVTPAFVVKAAKKDAIEIARYFRSVDTLALELDGELDVRAVAGGEDLGLIARLPAVAVEQFPDAGSMAMVVSAGGAKRKTLNPADFLLVEDVKLIRYGEAPPAGGRAWPKASATLIAFAEPLKPDLFPQETRKKLMIMASTIWNAVVMADDGGDPSALEQARMALSKDGMSAGITEMLVKRKRTEFGGDPRLIVVEDVAFDGLGLRLEAKWTMAPGVDATS